MLRLNYMLSFLQLGPQKEQSKVFFFFFFFFFFLKAITRSGDWPQVNILLGKGTRLATRGTVLLPTVDL